MCYFCYAIIPLIFVDEMKMKYFHYLCDLSFIRTFAHQCKNIEELILRDCNRLTDRYQFQFCLLYLSFTFVNIFVFELEKFVMIYMVALLLLLLWYHC